MKSALPVRFATVAMIFLSCTQAQAEMPIFENVRTVQPPPTADVAAAFFTVRNGGDEALSLTAVESTIAETTELHLSSVVDDVARMEEQAEIVIPAGESLEFKHGSYHVMLIGLHETLDIGDQYELRLTTNHGVITLTVPVVERSASGKSMHGSAAGGGSGHGDMTETPGEMSDPLHVLPNESN